MKALPPLEVGVAYEAADFEKFEYLSASLTGSRASLRLHLKNGTTLDLPASEEALRHLALVLGQVFGPDLIALYREIGWIPPASL